MYGAQYLLIRDDLALNDQEGPITLYLNRKGHWIRDKGKARYFLYEGDALKCMKEKYLKNTSVRLFTNLPGSHNNP